jgi:hypothetical protein
MNAHPLCTRLASASLWAFFVALSLALLPGLASAQTLGDPTRPPTLFQSAPGVEELSAGPRLQSVRIPRNGKAGALISGQFVELGARYGDAVLVSVRENEVVLKGPAGRETLKLTPDAEKTPSTPATPATNKALQRARSRQGGAAIESSGRTG